MHHRNQPCEEVTACHLCELMSCVERSSKLTHTEAAVRWALPGKSGQWPALGQMTHCLRFSSTWTSPSPSLSFTVISSLALSLSLSFSLRSLFSLSSFSQLTCCSPSAVHLLASLSALQTAAHSQWASSPPLILLPHSLSLLPLSLSHTHMCSLVVTSFISTLFVCSQAHTHMMWHTSEL